LFDEGKTHVLRLGLDQHLLQLLPWVFIGHDCASAKVSGSEVSQIGAVRPRILIT
jgi:hypothetical protein